MNYTVEKDKIIINGKDDFCPKHILECGQIFSYNKDGDNYIVYSGNKMAKICCEENGYVIETDATEYFVNFFDLKTNYSEIKQELLHNNKFLQQAINGGAGIRILNQDIFETIISFIISANNNIKRIRKILFAIRERYGDNQGEFYAFPKLSQLKKASVQDFKDLGAGYRAEYLFKTIRQLENEDLSLWKNLSTADLNKKLLSLTGVGQKVADCIMLFAFSKKDVFPVDTWIQKVYSKYFENESNRSIIRKNLVQNFKNLSGYAQQYLFYSMISEQ